MLDPVIQQFLDERKEMWLVKKLKKVTEEEEAEFQRQATENFALSTWLPDAAKRAKQLSIVSHPGKFSHPSAKVSPIIAEAARKPDGYLRTGNVETDLDVLGNAAAMDVYKFLSLKLSDGQSILAHLEQQTSEIEKQFTFPHVTYSELANGLLAIKQDDSAQAKTSGGVKQVYFPIEDEGYHLLSILTPSNVMYKLKERINHMRFSDEAKLAREARKKNEYSETPLSDVLDLSLIGYGGTKPQNISVLNSQNGGVAYLLQSLPPTLKKRTIKRPKTSFFKDILWAKNFTDEFQALHNLLISDDNNIHIRNKRDYLLRSVIYQVIDQVWMIRRLDAGWSAAEACQSLPKPQKIWLDQEYQQSREEDESWYESINSEFALWLSKAYRQVIGDKEVGLGDDHLPYFKSIVDECKEALI